MAGLVGIVLVFAFMLHQLPVARRHRVLALVFYTLIKLRPVPAIPVTLTLAGIAAFVLSVGMAVDANILIFERTKEELRAGKPLAAAVEAGFSRAWNSIFDSNVSTLMTAFILWYFGSSTVKGFALVLIIGVLTSMFTAITLSRMMLRCVVRARPGARRWAVRRSGVRVHGATCDDAPRQPPAGGARACLNAATRGRTRCSMSSGSATVFALSLLVTIPGLIFILATFFTGGKIGLQFAIDYTGGTVWVVRFADDAVSPDQVKSVMEAQGLEAAVTRIGEGFLEEPDRPTRPVGGRTVGRALGLCRAVGQRRRVREPRRLCQRRCVSERGALRECCTLSERLSGSESRRKPVPAVHRQAPAGRRRPALLRGAATRPCRPKGSSAISAARSGRTRPHRRAADADDRRPGGVLGPHRRRDPARSSSARWASSSGSPTGSGT